MELRDALDQITTIRSQLAATNHLQSLRAIPVALQNTWRDSRALLTLLPVKILQSTFLDWTLDVTAMAWIFIPAYCFAVP